MKRIQTLPCPLCKEQSVVEVNDEAYERWVGGAHIQHCFPEMTPQEREVLISGTHPSCWDEMWKDMDD